MPLDAIPIGSLSEEHLQRLVQDGEQENKTIEFKQELPGNGDADKKEFLADFTSFANTVGGDLIYGVRAPNGIAQEVVGLKGDLDAEMNRLENIIRTGIQPRVTGYSAKPIALENGKKVLFFRVPRSWALPHRVILGSHDKFYGRNSTGKYALDVPELRALFVLSETTADRIRAFRADRLALIGAGETPILLPNGPKTVLHIVPINAFAPGVNLDVSVLENDISVLRPLTASGELNYRHNFDGFVTFSNRRDSEEAIGYLQIFRNGSIEAVDTDLIRVYDSKLIIPGWRWEEALIQALPSYFEGQARLGIQPPVFVMLSVLYVKGGSMYVPCSAMPPGMGESSIDRDMLIFREIMVENFTDPPAQLMKPAFDGVWNAAGFPRSLSYNPQGQWVNQR